MTKLAKQSFAPSVQSRCDTPEFDRCEIGREAFPHYNRRVSVFVASVWLALYAIAGIYHFVASDSHAMASSTQLIVSGN